MFSAEQEAQLTKWGCPMEMMNPQPPPGKSIATDATLAYHPRQPHDVLAWLGGIDQCYLPSIEQQDDGRWEANVMRGDNLLGGTATDPYSAVYALAQAVMEAKC